MTEQTVTCRVLLVEDIESEAALVQKNLKRVSGWRFLIEHFDRLTPGIERARQGRYDVVCPRASAYELAARVPHAILQVIPDSGHSAWEPGTTRALVDAAAAALAAASSTASASPDYDGQEPLAQPLN